MTIQAYNTKTAILWGEFIQVVYQMYTADPTNTNPTQPGDFPAGWKLMANLIMDATVLKSQEEQLVGVVAQSTSDPTQIGFVFRGTIGFFDWFDDFEIIPVDFTDIANGGKVEDGFCTLYNSLTVMVPGQTGRQSIKDFISTLGSNAAITVTGHSLGGALAILHAAVLANTSNSLSPELYTFAAPMVGNSTFIATFEQLVPNSYRIYNKPDIVPTLPGEFLGYGQVNTGITINSLIYPIAHSLSCYHSLQTYLYVLGSTTANLGDCAATPGDTSAVIMPASGSTA